MDEDWKDLLRNIAALDARYLDVRYGGILSNAVREWQSKAVRILEQENRTTGD